jgi:hypothetical protein
MISAWDFQGILFEVSSKLIKASLLSKWWDLSVKRICLLYNKARPHTTTLAAETLEEIPHPAYSPDLVPSDFYLLSPFKEAIGGKKF